MLKKTTKRVGLLLSVFCFLIGFYELYVDMSENGQAFFYKANIITFILALVFLITSFYPIGRKVQISLVFSATILVVLDGNDEVISMGLLVLSMLLIYKYGYLKTFVLTKVFSMFTIFIAAMIFGIIRNNDNDYDVYKGIATLLFFTVFIITILIVMYDELSKYIKREKRFKNRIDMLSSELVETRNYLERIDGTFIDPVSAGLTKTEIVLLETLCLYRDSNADLGKRLKKSPNTVKVQLTKIMNKIGAETRYQLIDLCKNYFVEKPETAPEEPEQLNVTG